MNPTYPYDDTRRVYQAVKTAVITELTQNPLPGPKEPAAAAVVEALAECAGVLGYCWNLSEDQIEAALQEGFFIASGNQDLDDTSLADLIKPQT